MVALVGIDFISIRGNKLIVVLVPVNGMVKTPLSNAGITTALGVNITAILEAEAAIVPEAEYTNPLTASVALSP